MVQYSSLLDLQVMIFLLMLTGYLLRKWLVISPDCRKGLTDLVIDVVLPCNIIHSFLIEMNMEILMSGLVIFLVSIGVQLACAFLSPILFRKIPHGQQMVLKYATICSNAGFMGNPLVEGLYGSQGLLYASIYLIPQRVVMWTAGVSCFTPAKGRDVIKKVVTHPCIVAVFLGLLLMVFQVPLPSVLTKTINSLSNCCTALSMIVIGGILAEIDIRTVISRRTLFYSTLRLMLIPGLVLAACTLLHLDPLVSAVSTVLAGMPAGTTTVILAEKYNGDAPFAVKCVFLSTVLSLLTIPALCLLIEGIFS